ncbi:BTB/POZ domain-containing protein KCTD17, partial [Aphelenchoides avenae]
MNGTWIRLNIGGKIFQSTKQTLCRDPDSFLARLCQEDAELPSVKDDSGAILIDRDPQYFDIVLHYLRTGFLKAVENAPVEELVEEAEFYNLPLLSELIQKSAIATKPRKREQEIIIVTRHHKDPKVDIVMTVTDPNYV